MGLTIRISCIDIDYGFRKDREISMDEYKDWTNKGDRTTIIITDLALEMKTLYDQKCIELTDKLLNLKKEENEQRTPLNYSHRVQVPKAGMPILRWWRSLTGSHNNR